MALENNPMWNGGTSFEPYTADFNESFKERIRSRDNYCCVLCNTQQSNLDKALHVHHVNYDKSNSIKQNCASLCNSCHSRTNINRSSWILFFQNLLKERYGYQYNEKQMIILDFNKKKEMEF
ncbi:MAG: hypothetical protein DRN81_04260 [Thermoproteota archaeon]|nr:MAG: hypothetical protein DRN81_04260 [Candidatus Korarchaeota archaeon]